MMTYPFAIVLTLIVGLIPALGYLVSHRIPSGWRTMASIDASFWVVIVVLFYGWSLFRIFAAPGSIFVSTRAWGASEIVAIAFGLLLDAALWVRLWHWLHYSRRDRERSASGNAP